MKTSEERKGDKTKKQHNHKEYTKWKIIYIDEFDDR